MLLSELLRGVELVSQPGEALLGREIRDIRTDSHRDPAGCLYVCIPGHTFDGHSFAKAAEARGAAAILCERDTGCKEQILVPDTRRAYALICGNFRGNPGREMTLAAVTGTNGKTSVATLLKRLLEGAGVRAGLLSTIQTEYRRADGSLTVAELPRTTPDPWDLHRLLADMRREGIDAVAMEASSQAIDQKRLWGLRFSAAVFTNLTQDHLDYHTGMEDYYQAKRLLFSQADFAVVNIDDPYGERLCGEIGVPFWSCSAERPEADFFADGIRCGPDGVRFILRHGGETREIFFGIPGRYSVMNALCAAAASMRLGLSLSAAAKGLSASGPIRGRSELIETGRGFRVLCDYAHTPDGLYNLLKSTREYTVGRIVVLFGCGGDRDKTKRAKMGEIAAKFADFLIITSDNPRTEPPGAIIGDILRGVPGDTPHIVLPERRDAIRYALTTARPGDTVILAGKGHERYQVLGDKNVYFDERRLVEGILRTL